jgi:hypothetical protein
MTFLSTQIKHVIYIIKENRTYDQVLGDLDRGNVTDDVADRPVTVHVIHNQVRLDELNPSPSALKGIEREWAQASGKMDFSRPDVAGEGLLNRAIWYSTKGFHVPYPGDGRVLRPIEVELFADGGEDGRRTFTPSRRQARTSISSSCLEVPRSSRRCDVGK